MAQDVSQVDVYLEEGERWVFAGAVDWPGWSRRGKGEEAALQALLDYAPRYARAIESAQLGFEVPKDVSVFTVVERLEGGSTTDFGAPGSIPLGDEEPVSGEELERLQAILRVCWQALDRAVEAAEGHELQKGPRGGGRDADKIVDHVWGANAGYLRSLGATFKPDEDAPRDEQIRSTQQAMLDGLAAKVRGELPSEGPRGGTRWPARYFVRRAAWHILDHAWEIEDRII